MIVSNANLASEELILERGRRSVVNQRSADPQVPTANVEFIHPKLREEMKDEEGDPANPWVWLTSYSRVPVGFTQWSHYDHFAMKDLVHFML